MRHLLPWHHSLSSVLLLLLNSPAEGAAMIGPNLRRRQQESAAGRTVSKRFIWTCPRDGGAAVELCGPRDEDELPVFIKDK